MNWKRYNKIPFFLTILVGLCFGLGPLVSEPQSTKRPEPDSVASDPVRMGYFAMLEGFRQLADRHPELVTVLTGRSVGGLPLMMLRLGRKDAVTRSRPTIYISGATHGNEYMGIVSRLPFQFLEGHVLRAVSQTFFDQGGLIYLLPIANPDGYVHRPGSSGELEKRFNHQGVDLNRDFPFPPTGVVGKSQPETAMQTEILATDLQRMRARLLLTFDYHCCLQPGRLLHPWGYQEPGRVQMPDAQLSPTGMRAHKRIANVALTTLGYSSGTAWHEIHAADQVIGGVVGASDDYFYERYFHRQDEEGASFTFEGTPGEGARFSRHLAFWGEVLGTMLSLPRSQPSLSKLDERAGLPTRSPGR